jgi:hypothetical protein
MVTDLVLIQKIGSQLEKRRKPEENIFPLTPTHRKELRELKQKNIGNLKEQLRTLKQLKKDEYNKKYLSDLKIELEKHKQKVQELNTSWDKMINKINEMLDVRKKYEEEVGVESLSFSTDYGDLPQLNHIHYKRNAYLDIEKKSKEILDQEFEDEYGFAFTQVQTKIDDISTKYEEAINFGDLELVKQLYYLMKKSDKLFDGIQKMKI